MNFGLYASYLGMRARQQRLDMLANNIANASTSGFKADRLLYRSVAASENDPVQTQTVQEGDAQLTPVKRGVDVGVVTSQATDFSQGSVRDTGRALDVSLEGDGFLCVQTARGERYTRQGSLTLDQSGQLVTPQGDLVVGDGGPITIPPGEVSIGVDGTVSSNGQIAGKLKIVEFANPNQALTKEGASLFAATGKEKAVEASNTRVVQGSLEMSNVNSLVEMVAMMQNTREFESMQRSVSMLMNDIGRTISSELGKL
ncbi:MAG TPA: flagellar basal-body rod protein FlgF [Pyrinomonadaceae bacterium]|nr:flagellar basal-body rod protein FlgF [Pyrinomonadaceae bacterium]